MLRWVFDTVVIDLESREVRRAGSPVPLSTKAFQLLGILVSNRPKALSRQELQEQLWPDTFVVEKNLTNLISEIRAGLDDDALHPRFIRTVPRFGYAFIHPPADPARDAAGAVTAPAAESLESRPHNLPGKRTSFIGRERELAALAAQVSTTRLLTLVGVGGCGKTRLALELGRRLLDGFEGGVFLVDLAGLSEPALIEQCVASALELRQHPPASLMQVVTSALRRRRVLLIFDNCEHLVAACARIVDALLAGAPQLRILATSRVPLEVDGESVWQVPPLALPEPSDGDGVESAGPCEALRLFLARAAAADSTFRLTDTNGAALAEICQRLDGLPLAIELAAARLKVLSVEQIRDRLADRFELLRRDSHLALPRQRALEASVEWSYALLDAREQAVFQRLAVFAGGWTIDLAEAVCAGEGIERRHVLALLANLVNRSLVIVEEEGSEARRYRYLETIREYARRRLRESGDAERLGASHFAACLDLGRRAEPGLGGRDQLLWLNRLHSERDNLRTALEWSLSRPAQARHGLELASALVWFWIMRGAFGEGQHWIERAVSVNEEPAVTAVDAKAVTGLGDMMFFQGAIERSSRLFADGAARGRASGDLAVAAHALGMHSLACLELNDMTAGARLAAEALEAARSIAALEAAGPAVSFLAYQALVEGDVDRCARLQEELLNSARAIGHRWGVSIIAFDLALVRVLQGQTRDARALCAEAIALAREFSDRRGIAWSVGVLAGAEAVDERPLRAATLLGVMEGLCDRSGTPAQPSFKHWILDRHFGLVQERLGAGRYQEALNEGRAMPLDAALSYAFAGC